VSLPPSLSHCQRQSACARFSRIRCALTLTRIDSSESEYIEIDPGESEYTWIDPGCGSIAAQNRSPGPQAIVRAREHSPRGIRCNGGRKSRGCQTGPPDHALQRSTPRQPPQRSHRMSGIRNKSRTPNKSAAAAVDPRTAHVRGRPARKRKRPCRSQSRCRSQQPKLTGTVRLADRPPEPV
jgi:hypothetical protein